jgi:cullin-4
LLNIKGIKEITLSYYQAIVLLLFNDNEKLSFAEMIQATNIEPEELKKIVLTYLFGTSKLLGSSQVCY